MISFIKRIRIISNRIRKLLLPLTYRNIKLEEICEKLSDNPDSGRPIAVLIFFHSWKKTFMANYFPEYDLYFLKKKYHLKFIFKWLIQEDLNLITWGYRDEFLFPDFFKNKKNLIRVEDGFLRSLDLGKKRTTPLSLAVDYKGLYYNPNGVSDLENLLNYHEFTQKEIDEAKEAINLIKEFGISKYNHAPKIKLSSIIGPKSRPRVLVIGQVENDASIKYGCNKKLANIDLIKLAYEENPGCEIVYKIHPDVLTMTDFSSNSWKKLSQLCTVVANQIAPSSLFADVSKVYTLTSLMGFEALLHDLPVVCMGAPFYSNWGLTDDRQIVQRRLKKRTLEEVFSAAYILYPRYTCTNILSAISLLANNQENKYIKETFKVIS